MHDIRSGEGSSSSSQRRGWGRELISAGGAGGVGRPREGCRSFLRHPLGAGVSMMECAVLRSRESIRWRDHARAGDAAACCGGHDTHDYASTSLWIRPLSCPGRFLGGQRPHVVITQGVEDELQLAAGSSYDGNVVSSPLRHPVSKRS